MCGSSLGMFYSYISSDLGKEWKYFDTYFQVAEIKMFRYNSTQ